MKALTVCSLLSILLLIVIQSGQCARTVPVYVVKQNSTGLGVVEITLGKTGFKWHNPKSGITIIMRAPDWKLSAYNEANKKFLIISDQEAVEIFQNSKSRDNNRIIEIPIKIGEKGQVAGVPTIAYCYPHQPRVSKKFALDLAAASECGAALDATQQKFVNDALHHRRREYWMAKGIEVTPKIGLLFVDKVASRRLQLPLRMVQIGPDGTHTLMFDTVSLKKENLSPDVFKVPAGYTKAENKIALLINDSAFEQFAGSPAAATTSVTKKTNDSPW